MAVALAILLMTPLLIKLADGMFHHHEEESFISSDLVSIHAKYDECPIPGFEYSTFSKTKTFSAYKNIECYFQFNETLIESFFSETIEYFFHLRAPPRV
jgi:hypothetical protein